MRSVYPKLSLSVPLTSAILLRIVLNTLSQTMLLCLGLGPACCICSITEFIITMFFLQVDCYHLYPCYTDPSIEQSILHLWPRQNGQWPIRHFLPLRFEFEYFGNIPLFRADCDDSALFAFVSEALTLLRATSDFKQRSYGLVCSHLLMVLIDELHRLFLSLKFLKL